jgi:ankyrin repeat protein
VNQKLDVASALLDAGADATIASNDGTTTLMECFDVGMARRLLGLGVEVNARRASGENALLLACGRGDVEMASVLLDSGARRDDNDVWKAPLQGACRNGQTEVVALLLRSPGPSGRDNEVQWRCWLHEIHSGQTALHVAVEEGHVGCVQALVDAGFDVNTRNREEAPALHYAKDVEIARILLDAGATDLFCILRNTATSLALQDPTRVEILRLLLQRFPDCESPDRPLLHDAMEAGNLEGVRLLLAARPLGYVNTKALYGGHTALCACENEEMMRLLLELGADPRIVDNAGQTPLMMASNPACVRMLLDAAPDMVSIRDYWGRNALAHLSDSCDRYEALMELFRCCEEHGVDAGVDNKSNHGHPALHWAMVGANPRAVKLLLEKGADFLGSGREGTVLMMPFLQMRDGHGVPDPLDDKDSSECLTVVLDALLALGVEEVAGAVAGEAAEENREPDAKRRRTNKQ